MPIKPFELNRNGIEREREREQKCPGDTQSHPPNVEGTAARRMGEKSLTG
jgi:hypothetical protein